MDDTRVSKENMRKKMVLLAAFAMTLVSAVAAPTVSAVSLSKGMGNFFRDDIGGLAVFDRALTEQELEQLATAGEEGLRRTSRD